MDVCEDKLITCVARKAIRYFNRRWHFFIKNPGVAKIILATSIFFFVFISFSITMLGHWFITDDLGVIMNGYISNLSDFIRVFSEDMRNYATTYNYNLPLPNLFSGFLRPMQQVFFSIVYAVFDTQYYAYALLQTMFHALNATLFFIFLTTLLPISFATCGSLLLAFFPNMGWLTWICTLQHSLSLFFLLLALICFVQKHRFWIYISGTFFLLSLLSRESYIFFAPWLTFAIMIFSQETTILKKIRDGIAKTWPLLLATIMYVLMRVHAFGISSLARTINNVVIRFPCLAKASKIKLITHIASNVSLLHIIVIFLGILGIICLLIFTPKKYTKIAVVILSGIPVFAWPCILIYPASRYWHQAYPFFIFILLMGAYIVKKRIKQQHVQKATTTIFFMLLGSGITHGFITNIVSRLPHFPLKKTDTHYTRFFKENNIKPGSHLIFLSTLDESDLEQTLQAVSGDKTLSVAHIVISKLASKGQYWFDEDYRTEGVPYTITPVKNGYRLTSYDKYHCGWTFHSYQPVRWSEKERSYIRASEHFTEKVWYDFSMGKFFIHEMVHGNRYVTDVTFVFDTKWLTPHTQFVVWNTIKRKYDVLLT